MKSRELHLTVQSIKIVQHKVSFHVWCNVSFNTVDLANCSDAHTNNTLLAISVCVYTYTYISLCIYCLLTYAFICLMLHVVKISSCGVSHNLDFYLQFSSSWWPLSAHISQQMSTTINNDHYISQTTKTWDTKIEILTTFAPIKTAARAIGDTWEKGMPSTEIRTSVDTL